MRGSSAEALDRQQQQQQQQGQPRGRGQDVGHAFDGPDGLDASAWSEGGLHTELGSGPIASGPDDEEGGLLAAYSAELMQGSNTGVDAKPSSSGHINSAPSALYECSLMVLLSHGGAALGIWSTAGSLTHQAVITAYTVR